MSSGRVTTALAVMWPSGFAREKAAGERVTKSRIRTIEERSRPSEIAASRASRSARSAAASGVTGQF